MKFDGVQAISDQWNIWRVHNEDHATDDMIFEWDSLLLYYNWSLTLLFSLQGLLLFANLGTIRCLRWLLCFLRDHSRPTDKADNILTHHKLNSLISKQLVQRQKLIVLHNFCMLQSFKHRFWLIVNIQVLGFMLWRMLWLQLTDDFN